MSELDAWLAANRSTKNDPWWLKLGLTAVSLVLMGLFFTVVVVGFFLVFG
jgi:hypothetical protein